MLMSTKHSLLSTGRHNIHNIQTNLIHSSEQYYSLALFLIDQTWSFSYSYARHKLTTEKHAPALRAILMAMRIRYYGAEHIVQ